MEEGDKLKRSREKLLKENEDLKEDKELHDLLIQEKVQQHKNKKLLVKEVSSSSAV